MEMNKWKSTEHLTQTFSDLFILWMLQERFIFQDRWPVVSLTLSVEKIKLFCFSFGN